MTEPLRRRLRARALRAVTAVAGVAPAPLVRGGLGGLAALARWSRFERLTRANLELALGAETTTAERARIAAGVRRHAARQMAEWIRLANGAPRAWIEATVELDPSIERLHAELARGRGALIATAHLGNWELLAARLRALGLEGVVIGRRRPRDSSSDWLVEMRRAYGVTTLFQDAPPREVLRVLRRGETVGMLPDLEVRRLDGVFVDFFGVPALTMTAPAALARAHRAAVLPVRCVARGPERYRLSVDEPLALAEGLERGAATVDLVRRLAARFEAWIREDPEQWAWHQPRWRTRPGDPGSPSSTAADA